MNATTETRVPSPEQEAAREAPAPNLPAAAVTPVMNTPPNAGGFGSLVAAIAGVMADLEAVKKGGENTFHHYKYARMQDVLQMLTPLMGKHGIVVFQYEHDRNMFDDGKVIAITYNFVVAHKSGEQWPPVPQTGMSPCRTSKGTFDDKAFAKAHTSARKYFLLSLFQVPTEDDSDDPDNERGGTRAQAPVPGADGRVPPHKLEPTKNETFERWAGRYTVLLRTAATVAEVEAWDKANDELLGMMSNDEKGKPFYDRIMATADELTQRFGGAAQGAEVEPDPISTGPLVPDETALREMAAEDRKSGPRPVSVPDADKEPDAFMAWAQKRMDAINDPAELAVIWEGEITPWSDGLFLPDCKALEEHYNARLAKIGG